MNLPLDIPALLKAATDIDEARNTPLAVSVYIDETAPGDVVGHVRSAFASAGAKTRVTIGYLDDNLLAEPYGADDMAVIVAGDSPRIGEQAAHIRGAGIPAHGGHHSAPCRGRSCRGGRLAVPRGTSSRRT